MLVVLYNLGHQSLLEFLERNKLADEISMLYRRNYELSHLMKSHVSTTLKGNTSAPSGSLFGKSSSTKFC